jgi:nucleotide-binding universal stress UspA family protein
VTGRIVVPVDGSDFMERVVSEASELAMRYHLGLALLNVQTEDFYPGIGASKPIRQAEQRHDRMDAQRILDRARKMAEDYTDAVEIETVVLFGNPADEILKYADKIEADLIVIGSNESTDIKRLLLGSVSNKIVAHARQSVLVVK